MFEFVKMNKGYATSLFGDERLFKKVNLVESNLHRFSYEQGRKRRKKTRKSRKQRQRKTHKKHIKFIYKNNLKIN